METFSSNPEQLIPDININNLNIKSAGGSVRSNYVYLNNSVEEIVVSENNQHFKSMNKMLFTKDGNWLIGGIAKDIVIPEGTVGIARGAFFSNKLTSVTFPNSLQYVGENAFYSSSLESIDLKNVKVVFDSSFRKSKLKNINIVNLEYADSASFHENQITSISNMNSMIEIGGDAFSKNSISSISFPTTLKKINDLAFSENNLTNITIPNNVSEINYKSFSTNPITNITIDNASSGILIYDLYNYSGVVEKRPITYFTTTTGNITPTFLR